MPRTKEQFEIIRKETKEKILTSALELFSKKGYSNTSINDIAHTAGVSKGLAYNYFKNKNHLMEEVIKILFVEIGKMVLVLQNIEDPFQKIEMLIDSTFDMLKENRDFWKLYTSLLLQEEVKEIVDKIVGDFLQNAFKEIEKIFRKAKIKNAAAEAKLLGGLLDGISLHVLFIGNEYPIERMRKFLKQKYSKEQFGV